MRLLLVEDERYLRESLTRRLIEEGYRIDACEDGEQGLYYATEYPFDLAIVDLGLPRVSGLALIREVRRRANTLPILVLTARGHWQEKVQGLEAGADDYLVKPFEPAELLARIHALLRRAAGSGSPLLQRAGLTLDIKAQSIRHGEQTLSLTGYEYRLLEYLMRHSDEVVSKERLADWLYPHDEDRDSNVIEVLLARLRRKLAERGLRPIETVRGLGYRLNGRSAPER